MSSKWYDTWWLLWHLLCEHNCGHDSKRLNGLKKIIHTCTPLMVTNRHHRNKWEIQKYSNF